MYTKCAVYAMYAENTKNKRIWGIRMPVLVYANFKGGVGKTTNSVMTAYQLAKKGYKVLVCYELSNYW